MKFTEEQKQQVAELTLEFMEERKLSSNKFSKAANINATELTYVVGKDTNTGQYFVKNKWNDRKVGERLQPISDNFWAKLSDYVGFSVVPELWTDFEFTNKHIVIGKLEETRKWRSSVWIDGHVGTCKTESARTYVKENPHVAYIAEGVPSSPKSNAIRIAKAVGIRSIGKGDAYYILDLVIEHLKKQVHKSPILIIDEAENLTVKSWRLIKYLFDRLQNQIAIAVISSGGMYEKFRTKYEREEQGYSQNFSRFNHSEQTINVQMDEVKMVCKNYGIKNLKIQNLIYQRATDYRILRQTTEKIIRSFDPSKITLEDFQLLFNNY